MPSPPAHVHLKLEPLGTQVRLARGTALRDVLFQHGVEFPCGGHGQCRGCRVRVLAGNLPETPEQAAILSPTELEEGWRLSCQCRAEEDLTLELAQWKADVLVDESRFEFTPGKGLGIAIDVGTTTLVAQLLNLETGRVLGVRTALNRQAQHGADIMNRVAHALTSEGRTTLQKMVRGQLGKLIEDLLKSVSESEEPSHTDVPTEITEITLTGNTVMHHLFSGVDIAPLAAYPFEPTEDNLKTFTPAELGWSIPGKPTIRFLPCLGGFVGSDILAGLLATRCHENENLVCFVDLGTNGEIVVGNREGMLCASTAAGPAFEGAKITHGMRAATGAIYEVQPQNGNLLCRVVGNIEPRGLCGSGLVDAVAAGLSTGLILPNGRIASRENEILLAEPVKLLQCDIRQLQLAKGAIAAGCRVLLERFGVGLEDVHSVYLAGAFGNYVNRESARRIGLLKFPLERVSPVGNTSLLGAKQALFDPYRNPDAFEAIRCRVEHISLSSDPHFQEIYAEEMLFPSSSDLVDEG